ncbi:MAG: maltotransferase domain-containing protein, partial [Mycobacteriales bacterium]
MTSSASGASGVGRARRTVNLRRALTRRTLATGPPHGHPLAERHSPFVAGVGRRGINGYGRLVVGRIAVTEVAPSVSCGAYPARAVTGQTVPVTAKVFREG